MTYDEKMSEQPPKCVEEKISLGGKVVKSQTTACLTKYCEEDFCTGKKPRFCDFQGPILRFHQLWIIASQFRAHRFWEMQQLSQDKFLKICNNLNSTQPLMVLPGNISQSIRNNSFNWASKLLKPGVYKHYTDLE